MECEVVRLFPNDPPVNVGDRIEIPDSYRAMQMIEQRYVVAMPKAKRGRPPIEKEGEL